MGRHAHRLLKQPTKMRQADLHLICKDLRRKMLAQVLTDVSQDDLQACEMSMARINMTRLWCGEGTIALLQHHRRQHCHEALVRTRSLVEFIDELKSRGAD